MLNQYFCKLYLASILLLIGLSLSAQQTIWTTDGNDGTSFGSAKPLGISGDSLNRTYTTGSMYSKGDSSKYGSSYFDTGSRQFSAYIASHNVDGSVRWVKWIGGKSQGDIHIAPSSIQVVGNKLYTHILYRGDSIYLDTVKFPTITNSQLGFAVIQSDLQGNVEYVKFGSTLYGSGVHNLSGVMKVSANHEVYLYSRQYYYLAFGTDTLIQPKSHSDLRKSLTKLSLQGDSVVWTKNIRNIKNADEFHIHIDDSNEVHIMDQCGDTLEFAGQSYGKKRTHNNYLNSFIIHLDANGNINKTTFLPQILYFGQLIYNGNGDYWLAGELNRKSTIDIGKSKNIGFSHYRNYAILRFNVNQDSLIQLKKIGTYLFGLKPNTKQLIKSKDGGLFVGLIGDRAFYFDNDTIYLRKFGGDTYGLIKLDSSLDFQWHSSFEYVYTNLNNYPKVHIDTDDHVLVHAAGNPPFHFGTKLLNSTSLLTSSVLMTGKIGNCVYAHSAELKTDTSHLLCNNSQVQLKAKSKNVKYQWLYNNFPLPNADDSVYSAILPGNYSLQIDDNGCLDTSTTITVSNSPKIQLTFPSIGELCNQDSAYLLNQALPKGGTYSGLGVVSDSIFNTSISGKGLFPIQYNYTDTNGCSDSISQNVKVSGTIPLLNTFPSLCKNSKLIILNQGFPSGGSYFGQGVNSNTFNPIITGSGNHMIGYSYQSGTCFDTAYQSIQINDLPVVSFDSISPICETVFSYSLNEGKPTGGNYSSTFVIGNTFYPAISKDGTFPIQYAYTDTNGCSDTAIRNIYVDPADTSRLSPFNSICDNSASFSISGGSPWGGQYYVNGAFSTQITPTTLGSGVHSIQYKVNNSCLVDSSFQTLQIWTSPTTQIPGYSPRCEVADSITFSGGTPLGGTYYVNGNSDLGLNPLSVGPGTHSIQYAYTDSNQCSDTSIQAITIHAQPNVSFDSIPNLCTSMNSFTFSQGKPAGGIYSGAGVSINQIQPSVAGIGSHTIKYTYTDLNSCTDSADQQVQILSAANISHNSIAPICENANSLLISGGSPSGGLYSGSGVDSLGNLNPTLLNPGNHSIYYSVNNVCGKDSVQLSVSILGKPQINFNLVDSICSNADSISLLASPTGGIYTGTSVYNNKFFPAINPGNYSIGYKVIDTNFCQDSALQTIRVDSTPNVSLSAFPNLCLNAGPLQLNQGTPAGGSYIGQDVSGNNFSPTSNGVKTIQYRFTNSKGCSDSTSAQIIVDTVPIVSLQAPLNACLNESSKNLILKPQGGTLSGSGIFNGDFYPDSAGTGTHSLIYIFTDQNGCAESDTATIQVHGVPSITFNALNPVCANSDSVLLNASPLGGTFSGISVSDSLFNPKVGTGLYQISYTYVDSNACADSVKQSIQVDTVPIVTLSAFPAICLNSSPQNLTQGLPTGGVYTGSGVSNGNYTPNTSGIDTIQYSVTDLNGCTDSLFGLIQVDTVPIVTFTAPMNQCLNAGSLVLKSGLPVGGTYSGSGISNNVFYPDTSGIGWHYMYYSYSDLNGCADTVLDSIRVYPLPALSFATVDSVCANADSITLIASPSGGQFIGTSVYGNKFVPSISPKVYTLGYLYTDTNSCTDTVSLSLRVDSVPRVTISSFPKLCANSDSLVLTQGSPVGGVYNGMMVNNGIFTPQLIGAFNLSYKFTDLKGCSDSITSQIIVDSVPDINFTIDSSICKNATAQNLNAQPSGGIYSGIGVSGSTYLPALVNNTKDTITYTFIDANGCKDSVSRFIEIDTVPNVMLSQFAEKCDNSQPFLLNQGIPAGGYYYSSFIDSSGLFDPNLSGSGNFTIGYKYSDLNGCADSVYSQQKINASPQFDLGPDTTICNTQLLILETGIADAVHFWNDSSRNITLQISNAGEYWVHVIDSNSCSFSDTIKVEYEAICVGIEELTELVKYSVFPNPTDGSIFISFENDIEELVSLQLLNSNGQQVISEYVILLGELTEVPLHDLSNGVYYLRMQLNNSTKTHRIILNK